MSASDAVRDEIEEIVGRETRAWDTQDVPLLLSVFHPDMVWPWPPTPRDHDPMTWELPLGKFDYRRWAALYGDLFARFRLVHNVRIIRRIEISAEEDGAFAVVDIDTLWQAATGEQMHWQGRTCKVYAKTGGEWKLTMHTGVLAY